MKKSYIIPQSEMIALEGATTILTGSVLDPSSDTPTVKPSTDPYDGEFSTKRSTNPVNWDN